MFDFSSRTSQQSCGVMVDIGSGSVGVAIVISNTQEEKPIIVWTHREYVLIKDINSTEVPLKEITTSLINVFLQLGSQGMKTLYTHDKNVSIDTMQVTISAPWTYTVTKTINFSDEHPFEVTDELINELSATAEKQAFTAVLESEIFQENQLEIIDNKTISTTVNGYQVNNPDKIKTRDISLAHITAITQRKILSVLEDSKTKILQKAELTTHSFMYMYYDVLKHLRPNSSEACLIDITSEATEIGIIREGTLTHVTNTAFGTFSLAREIASLCNIPKEEAYSYLKGNSHFMETKLSKSKLIELNTILEAYEEKIAELLKTTGDTLSIPKTIFLHCEASSEEFFLKHINKAAKMATTLQHKIHPVTSLLLKGKVIDNSSILLSAHYFHRTHIKKYEA